MGLGSLRGVSGEVRYAYHLAAKLGPWTLSEGRLDAETSYRNDTWIECGKLKLSVDIGKQVWTWREIELIDNAPKVLSLRVLGEPEISTREED